MSDSILVYVHGLGDHRPGYSSTWWHALSPHLPWQQSQVREVVWADLLLGERATPAELALAIEIASELESRMKLIGGPLKMRGGIGLPEIGELVAYLCRPDMRRQVIERLESLVWPLLALGGDVHIISHSWGTVVAYEGLCQLGRGIWPGGVRTWFTAGAALSFRTVQRLLMPAPEGALDFVRQWTNLNARWDVVGGSLEGRYPITHEYLDLEPTGCGVLPDPVVAHGSYFREGNLVVNRDIFAGGMLADTRPPG